MTEPPALRDRLLALRADALKRAVPVDDGELIG